MSRDEVLYQLLRLPTLVVECRFQAYHI